MYRVHRLLPGGNVILECDDDGSLQNDDSPVGDGSPQQVLQTWEIWQPGMVIQDRTGKSVFCRGEAPRRSFYGIPPLEIEQRVLASQPPSASPRPR